MCAEKQDKLDQETLHQRVTWFFSSFFKQQVYLLASVLNILAHWYCIAASVLSFTSVDLLKVISYIKLFLKQKFQSMQANTLESTYKNTAHDNLLGIVMQIPVAITFCIDSIEKQTGHNNTIVSTV